jgi:hypothetical protein
VATPSFNTCSTIQSGKDGYLSSEFREDFGIIDLHSIDDTKFFPEVIIFAIYNYFL